MLKEHKKKKKKELLNVYTKDYNKGKKYRVSSEMGKQVYMKQSLMILPC